MACNVLRCLAVIVHHLLHRRLTLGLSRAGSPRRLQALVGRTMREVPEKRAPPRLQLHPQPTRGPPMPPG
jgi:hypothetical protein